MQGTMTQLIKLGGASTTPADSEQPSSPNTGFRLNGRFLLGELLGEGGMGKVFKALDLRREEVHDPNPYVAIKLLHDDIRRITGSAMALQREAVVAQTLKHGGIASVYDYNRDGPHAYIVMELIEGYTLDQLIISDYPEGLPGSKAFKLIGSLIQALRFAHRKGVVHADIKPSNIKILPDGSGKIMDFGLARMTSLLGVSQDANKGTNNAAIGPQRLRASLSNAVTPSYATRARIQGRQPVRVDDVYALGCVIYLILTGRHPYQQTPRETAVKAGFKPERPRRLTKKQWQVLQAAIDPNIDKASTAVDGLSEQFSPRRQAVKKTRRRRYWCAAALLLLAVSVPITHWSNNDLPVWQIRFAEEPVKLSRLDLLLSDLSLERYQALQKIYLPFLLQRWALRWKNRVTASPPDFGRLVEATQLRHDVAIAERLTPLFSGDDLFMQSRERLEAIRATYVTERLDHYEEQLLAALAQKTTVSEAKLLAFYQIYEALEAIGGPAKLVQDDPRLIALLRREVRREWEEGRYLPLVEKLMVAKRLFPQNRAFVQATERLNIALVSPPNELDGVEVEPLLKVDQGTGDLTPVLNFRPVLLEIIKGLMVASSNNLDLNPVHRDRFVNTQRRYLRNGGSENGWQQEIRLATLQYGRALARWGRTADAYALVDEMLAENLR